VQDISDLISRDACLSLSLLLQERKINLTIWMTLLSQAGFSLGLAAEVAHQFPGWGRKFQVAENLSTHFFMSAHLARRFSQKELAMGLVKQKKLR